MLVFDHSVPAPTIKDASGMIEVTNFNCTGIGYIRLASAGPNWDADSTYTNVFIKYSYKISTP